MKQEPRTENHVKAKVNDWFEHTKGWSYSPIQNGLGVHGIPDRLGVVPITITATMVGKKVGLFVAVEAKKPGRRSEKNRGMSTHQFNNMNAINAAGGISICCDGVDDLNELSGKIGDLVGLWDKS